jgi:hypothetical protein
MNKDKRLQIRVSTTELEGIGRRAKAAGLSVAEYGRKRLLSVDEPMLAVQESLGFEDPGLSREEILEPDDPEHVAAVRKIMAENGFPASDWTPTIPGRVIEQCDVKDLPPGVRCKECGFVHGS